MKENAEEWDRIVPEVHFLHSACDKHLAENDSDLVHAFRCDLCVDCTFASERALKAHKRAKHQVRTEIRFFADEDGQCQCCRTAFSSRLRLVAHLSDARRPSCREWMFVHGSKLDETRVAELDELDKAARNTARAGGLTQPLSRGPAYSARGKILGRAHR